MNKPVFISAREALERYGVVDVRTLKAWARDGMILYQVLYPNKRKQVWFFESPEARYERTMATNL